MAQTETNAATGQHIRELDREYVLHSWSVQSQINPLPVAGAEGRHFWDYEGKRYLDFCSQLVNLNLGHQHPAWWRPSWSRRRRSAPSPRRWPIDKRSELASLLAELTPGNLKMSFFTNGGAEANENAIKLARWYTGRHKIIARYRSYHGATAGAVTLTGDPRRWPAEPGLPGVVHMFDPVHVPLSGRCIPSPARCARAARIWRRSCSTRGRRPSAAVILETVTGTNGIIVPPDGYLSSVREVCDRHGILLILDEVMAGFGRTGRWFACDHWDVAPDIMTVRQGHQLRLRAARGDGRERAHRRVAGGQVPRRRAHLQRAPLGCAAAVASISVFREEKIVENAAAMGDVLAAELPKLAARTPRSATYAGLGLFWGLELVRSRATREPLVPFNATGEANRRWRAWARRPWRAASS